MMCVMVLTIARMDPMNRLVIKICPLLDQQRLVAHVVFTHVTSVSVTLWSPYAMANTTVWTVLMSEIAPHPHIEYIKSWKWALKILVSQITV